MLPFLRNAKENYSVAVMSQANRIREFVRDHYIAPARAAGRTEITIRAGDVHQEMSLTNAMPAVCSAIGSRKFDRFAGVMRTALIGPIGPADLGPADRGGAFYFPHANTNRGILNHAESAPVRFFGGRTVEDFRGQRLFASSVNWRALLIWMVIIVSFCLLFQLCTHALPSRIAAVILR